MAEASLIITALMISQNRPSDTRVSGKVTIFRNSPRVALTNPITTAAISAENGPLTEKPGTNRETIQIASAVTTHCSNIRMTQPSLRQMQGDYTAGAEGGANGSVSSSQRAAGSRH